MKFTQIIAATLLCSSQAIRLSQKVMNKLPHEHMGPEEIFDAIDAHDGTMDGHITYEQVENAVAAYAEEHGLEAPENLEEIKKAVKDFLAAADENEDGVVTKEELGLAIFHAIDQDGDEHWSWEELSGALHWLAEQAGTELVEGWEKAVKPGFDEVAGKDGLVSIPEIAAAVRKHGVPNFQKLFKNHPDNEKAVQVTDETDKTVFDALLEQAKSDDGITPDELIGMTKDFAKAHGVKLPEGWEEEAKKVHRAADANGDGSVGPVELVESIFDAFDHSAPKEKLTLKEVRQAIQWLSKQLGKPLKKGWKKMVRVGFAAADANNDGAVSMEEFKAAVAEHGLPIEELFK